jgi:hypothetical protein
MEETEGTFTNYAYFIHSFLLLSLAKCLIKTIYFIITIIILKIFVHFIFSKQHLKFHYFIIYRKFFNTFNIWGSEKYVNMEKVYLTLKV